MQGLNLFKQPIRTTLDAIEGVIVVVDSKSRAMQVRTVSGQMLSVSSWLSNSGGSNRETDADLPSVGTSVLVYLGTGQPIILGCLEHATANRAVGVSPLVTTQYGALNYSNLTPLPAPLSFNPSDPPDALRGDKILSTKGGVTIAALFSSILLRASGMAQIVITKLDDLVRIIGRNVEVFTDAITDVIANFRGRGYRFTGTSLSVGDQRSSLYNYYSVLGDTVAGETLKENYYGVAASSVPPANSYIFKKVVCSWNSGVQNNLYVQTLDASAGVETTEVIGATTTLQITHQGDSWVAQLYSNGNPLASFNITPTNAEMIFQSGYVNITGSELEASYGSGTLIINGSQLQAAYSSSLMTLDSSQAQLSSGGHAVTVNSSGVTTS